jgi:TonB family protein
MKQLLICVLCLTLFFSLAAGQSGETEKIRQLNNKVVELFRTKNFDEAHPLAQEAFTLCEKNLADSDPLFSAAAYNLAEILLSQKQPGKAQSAFRRALELYEKQFGKENPRVAAVLDRLAVAAFNNSDMSAAESAMKQAIQIREKVFGPESKEVAQSLGQLAWAYELKGKYQEAAPLYRRVLDLKTKLLGADHKETKEAMQQCACVLRKKGAKKEAAELENAAQTISGQAVSQPIVGGVINGRALHLPRPSYPAAAKEARAGGTVSVRVVIDESGQVLRACAITGHPLLAQAAENAAYGARFTPTSLDNKPVKVTGIINYNFVSR